MGKSTISMAIFNSYVSHYQRVCPYANFETKAAWLLSSLNEARSKNFRKLMGSHGIGASNFETKHGFGKRYEINVAYYM